LCIDSLEDRLAPATFTGVGTALTIDLNNPNEAITFSTNGTTITAALTGGTAADGGGNGTNVTGFGTSTALITSGAFTTISVTDSAAGTSAAFANSTGTYPQAFNITLNDPASANVTFAGTSQFGASFTASTTAGFFASAATASVTLSGAGSNLSLTATGHDILLAGVLTVGGTTSLAGNVIQADNSANDFVGALQLSGPVVASIFDVNDLTLAASSFNFGSLNQTTRITAGGNITQTGALTTTGSTGTLAVTSTGGSITLTNPGNALSANVALALSATGANAVSVVNTAGLQLGDVTLGTGALSLTAAGTITQGVGTTIQTGGAVTTTTATNNRDVLLGNAGNNIAGTVTAVESGAGFLRDYSLRNAFDNATLPAGTPFTTANDIRNLTLFFDNNGIALPGYSITGNLTVTAGGDITQTAALTVGGNATFTVLGDFGLNVSNANNNFGGPVSLNDPKSTQPVVVAETGGLTLGPSALGRGTFSATAATGSITSTAPITQQKGAGTATFTVTAGNTISLTGANDFPGSVVFAGAGLTTVNVRNTDFQSAFTNLTIPGSVTDLTVRFDNAGIVLPSLNLTNLHVTALGIFQAPSAALVLSGIGGFNAGAYPLNLSNPSNDFATLTLSNSGRNDVAVTDINAVTFAGNSQIGTGRLTVTAGGNITAQGPNGRITEQNNAGPIGAVQLTSTGGSITLDNNNAFRGSLSVTVSGANSASLTNDTAPLVLGSVTTGTGSLSITDNSVGISQDPNSVLSIGGPSSFSAGTAITLTNRTNTFAGPVTLNAGDASIRATGPIVLAASQLTGDLNVKTGGKATDSITQTGTVTVGGAATFDAGAGNVILTDPGNDFGSVSVFSTGTSVSVTDTSVLNVGNFVVGGGTLTLVSGDNIDLAGPGSGIVQTTGTGAITLTTPVGYDINLGSAINVLRGPVTVINSNNVTLQTQGDLTFTPGSAIGGNLTATAGGVLTLPADLTNLNALTVSAQSTTVGSDIVAGGPVSFTGAVAFTGNRAIDAGGSVTFAGDVTAGGSLTFTLPNGQTLQLAQGYWTQGANPLTINGTNVSFRVGNGAGAPARLVKAGGTISMPGNGGVTVLTDGTFQVGTNPAAAETVTVSNGTGGLTIGGTLAVGFGATNDELIKTGDGLVTLTNTARLEGSGLAATTATPVLASQTALIVGRFTNSVDASDTPHDFFAGSDIVTPAYSFVDVTVKAGGVAAPSGTATGTLPDGDRFTVNSSLGGAAGLATVVDLSGNLDVVVRNTTAAAASTLTFSALGGGDGLLPVGGVAIHTPGAVTVTAPAANFVGDFTTAGTLTALTARDLGTVAAPFTLNDGGPTTGASSITARVVQNTTATIAGPLKTFKAVSATNGVSLTAQSFGSLSTTGLAAVVNPGDFNATLTSTTTASGPVVTTGTFAGTLGGTWDVRGSVGTVKAFKTTNWNLGTIPGANIHNGGLLTNVTSLALGPVTTSTINASGAVTTMTTSDVGSSTFTAGSWGTVTVAANSALGLVGNVTGSSLIATGNAAGVGLKSLSIAGDLTGNSTVSLLNGDATAITVGRTINASSIAATDTGTRGALKAVTAGRLASATLTGRSIGTLTVKGNLPAGLFGDITGSTVTGTSNAAGVGIGTVSASGSVTGSTFDVQSGNLTTFTVGRQLGSSTVRLSDPAFSTLGTIQAGDWTSGDTVLAKTIATVASIGAAALAPASPLLLGGIVSDTITAYQNTGTTAPVGSLSTKGDFSGSTLTAERGIGTVTIGRGLTNSFVIADAAQSGATAVGLVKTMTMGAVTNSTVAANTLGTVKVTGYSQPESPTVSFVPGDVTTGTITAAGGSAGVSGITSLSVARHVQTNSFLKAQFGIKTLTVGGSVSTGSQIVTDNPLTPTAGALGTVIVGELNAATVRTGSIGAMKVTGNTTLSLLGSASNSTISADSTAAAKAKAGPQAIGSLTMAGDFTNSVLDAPASVGSITVGGRVTSLSSGARIDAGYNTGGKLGTVTVGAWGTAGIALTTDLVSQAVGTFSLKGNVARGFVGTADRAFVDILGSAGGVGLGTFSGTGTSTNSLFRVSNSDVGSFTVLRFLSSDLLVGFRPVKGSDLTLAPAAANWSATNHKIGSFTTTAPFDPKDPADSASFQNSTVVAAILGNVTLSGVNPTDPTATTFGVAFRTAAGASAKGVVKKGGVTLTPGPSATDGQFHYLGLPG
jgi:hypothetical protein